MGNHPLKERLLAGDTELGLTELLAGIIDIDAPESHLELAEQLVATGYDAWAPREAEDRATGLGLTRRQAQRLRLCALLAARLDREDWAMPSAVVGPADVLAHVGDIRAGHREKVVALYLDVRNRPLHRELIAVGGLRASIVQPRDVLAPALNRPVAGIILVHNHPSGDTRPSAEDLEVTRLLAGAARVFGVELVDHLVVSRSGYTSIKEMGGL